MIATGTSLLLLALSSPGPCTQESSDARSPRDARGSQVLQTPEGEAEFIGLETLTAEELMRRLTEHDEPKSPHLCAATFKEVGLADAAVSWTFEQNRRTVIVIAVEQESRVRYHAEPTEKGRELPASWAPILEGMRDPGTFQFVVILYGRRLADLGATAQEILAPARAEMGIELPEAAVVAGWDALATASEPEDLELALWTLAHDRDASRRAAAACVLMNFSDDERAWHALMSGQRDANGTVTTACEQALRTLSKHLPRRIDWKPAADSIRALLDGTNPFALMVTLETLVATEVSPELATELLPRGGGLVTDLARARAKTHRAAALALLRRLSSRPDASDSDLVAWAATLHG